LVGAGKPGVAHSVTVEVMVTVTAVQPAEYRVSVKIHCVLASKLTVMAIVSDDNACKRSNCEELLEAEHVDSCGFECGDVVELV
jgi:hypothetical protein